MPQAWEAHREQLREGGVLRLFVVLRLAPRRDRGAMEDDHIEEGVQQKDVIRLQPGQPTCAPLARGGRNLLHTRCKHMYTLRRIVAAGALEHPLRSMQEASVKGQAHRGRPRKRVGQRGG